MPNTAIPANIDTSKGITREPTRLTRREFLVALAGAVSLVALPLSACKSGETSLQLQPTTVFPPAISTNGVLKVGVATNNIPFAGRTEGATATSRIIGLDVDIAAAMADQMGLRLKLVDIAETSLTELFLNQEIDLFMGYQPDNMLSSPYVLIGPYMLDGPAVFTIGLRMPPGPFDITSLSGQTFAVRGNSLSSWQLEQRFGLQAIQAYASLAEAFEAVADGEVSYVAADAVAGAYQSGKHRDFLCLGFIEDPRRVFIGVAPGNQEMTDAAGKAWRELRDNGTLRVIVNKWLGYTATDLVLNTLGTSGTGVPIDTGDDLPDPSDSHLSPGDGAE